MELVSNTDLALIPTPDLRRMLVEALGLTAQRLRQVASLIAELERRGEDLSELRITMLAHLRAIAAGTLLPEAVERYARRPTVLRRVMEMPISEQQRLLELASVEVLNVNGTVKSLPPLAVPHNQVGQVFGECGVRSVEEQRAVLVKRKMPAQRNGPVCRPTKAEMADDLDDDSTVEDSSVIPRGAELEYAKKQLALGSPGDVAESLLEVVNASAEPFAVAQRLIMELGKIRKPRQMAV